MAAESLDAGFVPLFDGKTLDGWYAVPRSYGTMWPGGPGIRSVFPDLPLEYEENAAAHPAHWEVVDEAIEGFQDPAVSGYGGYLVTEQTFADFELVLEMKPDWPADTGVMLRRRRNDWAGFQVLVDHRKSGSIGGFFGNGTGSFHAVPYVLDVSTDSLGRPNGLTIEDPATSTEPMSADKSALLTRCGDPQQFLKEWRFGGWNHLRIRCVGMKPTITTWVNDVLVAEIDLGGLTHPHYDPDAVATELGRAGHIALEVHDNDQRLGRARWGAGARCRWRRIAIKTLHSTTAGPDPDQDRVHAPTTPRVSDPSNSH